jgi:hypothetical protein
MGKRICTFGAAAIVLAGSLIAGPAVGAEVYVKIAPPSAGCRGQGRVAGRRLRLGRWIPPVERNRLRVGSGPLGPSPARGRRLGAGTLEEHAARLGLEERALALRRRARLTR